MPSITFDPSNCTRCGACASECPVQAIVLGARPGPHAEAPLPTVNDHCIGCGHCGAVCPADAVRAPEGPFVPWRAPAISASDARAFLTGRRSVRRYRPTPISPEQLRELLSVAAFAPTASNSRDVSATLLTGERVFELAGAVNDYYSSFEKLLSQRLLWPLLWFTAARPYLKNPKKIASVRQKSRQFDRQHDWIFLGAPAVVVLSAPRKNRSFGHTNCVIAAERILQYAFALGLGSCWIGYAEVAMTRRRSIALAAGVPPDHETHAVFILGEPAVEFRRLPARSPIPIQ